MSRFDRSPSSARKSERCANDASPLELDERVLDRRYVDMEAKRLGGALPLWDGDVAPAGASVMVLLRDCVAGAGTIDKAEDGLPSDALASDRRPPVSSSCFSLDGGTMKSAGPKDRSPVEMINSDPQT